MKNTLLRWAGVWCLPMLALLLTATVSYGQGAESTPSAGAAGATSSYQYGYWLPPVASEHGPQIDRMINVLHWFMGAIFVGWGTFFVWCLVKFRARPGHKADPTHIKAKSTKVIEVLVAAFEVVLLVGFSIPLWAQAKTQIPDEKDAFVVHVTAEQFAWNVHYPGVAEDPASPTGYRYTDFGRTSPGLVSLSTGNFVGLDASDENAKDDVQMQGTLRVPLNKTVLIKLSSKDVIHSFYLPVMRVKQDAIPGMQIPVWFKPTEKGTSQIQCAQLCGNNHSIMKGTLIVEDEKDVQKWIIEQHAAASATFEE